MLSRSQIFEKVQAINESLEIVAKRIAVARTEIIRVAKEDRFDKAIKKFTDDLKDSSEKLARQLNVLRQMRGNALWEFEQRLMLDGSNKKKKSQVTVGDRMFALIQQDPKYKAYKKPRRSGSGMLMGRIGNLKVVLNGKARK